MRALPRTEIPGFELDLSAEAADRHASEWDTRFAFRKKSPTAEGRHGNGNRLCENDLRDNKCSIFCERVFTDDVFV